MTKEKFDTAKDILNDIDTYKKISTMFSKNNCNATLFFDCVHGFEFEPPQEESIKIPNELITLISNFANKQLNILSSKFEKL